MGGRKKRVVKGLGELVWGLRVPVTKGPPVNSASLFDWLDRGASQMNPLLDF